MSVEDAAERERLELEDRLNDLIITLGYGAAYEVESNRGGTGYLFAVHGGSERSFHPFYLYEHTDGRIGFSEAHEADLKWAMRKGIERTDLPEHIARWYTLIGIDYRNGGLS